MNTRTWLVLACIAFYIYWLNLSSAQTTQQGAAGTPVGTTPVSTISVTPQASTTAVPTITALGNMIANSLSPAPNLSQTQQIQQPLLSPPKTLVNFDHTTDGPILGVYDD